MFGYRLGTIDTPLPQENTVESTEMKYHSSVGKWSCIICGFRNKNSEAIREAMFCGKCNSTWRVRATALGVLVGTGFDKAPFPELSPNWAWRGVGASDHMALVAALASKFDYTNSYYHRFPRLDLLNVSEDQRRQFGFVICSDVLEHVLPPADRALAGIADLLHDHGFAVLSVPNTSLRRGMTAARAKGAPTIEYYPGLKTWKENEGRVEWLDDNGDIHTDFEPEFHGGGGQTLAFRQWGMGDFCARVIAAGFKAIGDIPANPELGVPEIEDSGIFIAHIDR
jgi:SAM-dependent methyltransferase